MAKNEHVVVRSSVWAAIGVCIVEIVVNFSAAFVYLANPSLESSSMVMIWAAMNLMSLGVGVLLLTGILAAGISPGSTFLSLIGFSATNDMKEFHSDGKRLKTTRVVMVVASLVILVLAYFNPPAIFWVMYFGSSCLACSWGPVAVASVWSKRVTERGAFWGMLLGFVSCFTAKLCVQLFGLDLPVFLDPFIIGLVVCIAGLVVGSLCTKPTADQVAFHDNIHIIPPEETCPCDVVKTRRTGLAVICFGVLVATFFVVGYAVPVLGAL